MDLDKLEKMAKLVLKELPNSHNKLSLNPQYEARFRNLLTFATKCLPDHEELFSVAYNRIHVRYGALTMSEALSVIRHLLDIIEIEKSFQKRKDDVRVFESAEEKIKQAALSFQQEDFTSTFHCLNTAFELVLKDKIGIPTTITGINTSNIVEVLVKYRIKPYLYFKEVRKRVTEIDNKIKHQGYSPSKIDAINGIKAMEDLISKLKSKELKLTDEVKTKICEGL